MPEPQGGNSTALALTLDMLEMPAEELERRFRDVWGNNADEIRWKPFHCIIPNVVKYKAHRIQAIVYLNRVDAQQ